VLPGEQPPYPGCHSLGSGEVTEAHPGGFLGAAAIFVAGWGLPRGVTEEQARKRGQSSMAGLRQQAPWPRRAEDACSRSDYRLDAVWTPVGLGVSCKGFAVTQLPRKAQSQAAGPSPVWHTVGCSGVRRASNAGPLCAWGFTGPLKLGCFIYNFP